LLLRGTTALYQIITAALMHFHMFFTPERLLLHQLIMNTDNNMRRSVSSLMIIPLISGCSVFGFSNVEEARYDVLIADDHYELRQYEPMVIAETCIEGDFDQAGNQAFRKLFGYISGDNTSTSEIAMTAPVIADTGRPGNGEKIDMTVPVLEQKNDQCWRYMFVLPAGYTIQTAPQPLQQDVKLSSQPQKRVAVIRYPGSSDENAIDEKTVQLRQWINANDLTAVSEPRWAGYNPPWTLPFLRRNEVMIDVN
jgi:hypothetical protein